MPTLTLEIANALNASPQTVEDEDGNNSALWLASQQVSVQGTDTVSGSLPLYCSGATSSKNFTNGTTWGRIIRIQDSGTSQKFYDLGIDQNGNLFLNTPNSTQTTHVLTIAPTGMITLNASNGLAITGLPSASGSGYTELVTDSNGNIYTQ